MSGHFLDFLELYILQALERKFVWTIKWRSHNHTKSQSKRILQQLCNSEHGAKAIEGGGIKVMDLQGISQKIHSIALKEYFIFKVSFIVFK